MTLDDILTSRLRLVALSDALLRADFANDKRLFSALLGARVPGGWPPEHWEPHCFSFLQEQFSYHPHTRAWGRYVLLREHPQVLIGNLGAFPRSSAEVEIGYGILPPWQRNGYATEAVQVLVAELFKTGQVQTITAQTFPHLTGSLRVMERCAMQPVGPGDEPGTVRYQLSRPPGTST